MTSEASESFADKRYVAVWVSAPDPMVFFDDEGLIDCNEAAMRLLGFPDESSLIGMPLHHFALEEQPHGVNSGEHIRTHFEAALAEGQSRFECQFRCSDGSLFVADIRLHRVALAGGRIVHAVLRDISLRWEAEQNMRTLKDAMEANLRHLTYYDAVTGLSNRRNFVEQATAVVERGSELGRPVAMCCVAINNLSSINNTLGREAGDEVLRTVAKRLKHSIQETDLVARLGDNLFGVLLDGCAESFSAGVAGRLIGAMGAPIFAGGHEISIGCSIGLAMLGRDGRDLWTLMENADTAMHRAKSSGEGIYQFYSGDMNVMALERLVLESRLRHALEQKEFIVHYQPIVDAASGCISGVEALIRWQNPELGLVSPARFIPLAEQSGLIVSIGEWVLAEACRQARVWRDAGLPAIEMCVNLSPRQFHRPDLLESLQRVLADTVMPPECLVLELTEGALMAHTDETVRTLAELRKMGVRLAIDDFGTGYSSLAYLKCFPVNKLKVDQSFVRAVGDGDDDVMIAKAIVNLGRNLRLDVVAEGIESAAELEALCSYGCGYLQGFYFSKPRPANEIEVLLRDSAQGKPLKATL